MRPAIFTAAVIAAGVFALRTQAADTRPSFHGLGDLPGGEFRSKASAVSADGTTVIGRSIYAEEPGSEGIAAATRYGPFRWSETEGMVPLEPLSGTDYDYNYAGALSSDGSVIAGHATTPPSSPWPLTDPFPRQAFRWTQGTGAVGLGYFEGSTWESSRATGVCADGSAVVGESYGVSNFEAFRWTESGGMQGLGVLPGSDSTQATAVSADAAVVVGTAFNQDEVLEQTPFSVQAFRWTESGGTEGLGFLDGLTASRATGVSADGSAVVGVAHIAQGPLVVIGESLRVAFRWTESQGMVPLEVYWEDTPDGRVIVGGGFSEARGVSGDGSIIVGATRFGYEPTGPAEAFIWTEADGMRSLQDFLVADCGLDLTGWTLADASGISADGLTIVGTGINPDGFDEAWIATVPEPAALLLLAACWPILLRRRRSG